MNDIDSTHNTQPSAASAADRQDRGYTINATPKKNDTLKTVLIFVGILVIFGICSLAVRFALATYILHDTAERRKELEEDIKETMEYKQCYDNCVAKCSDDESFLCVTKCEQEECKE